MIFTLTNTATPIIWIWFECYGSNFTIYAKMSQKLIF